MIFYDNAEAINGFAKVHGVSMQKDFDVVLPLNHASAFISAANDVIDAVASHCSVTEP